MREKIPALNWKIPALLKGQAQGLIFWSLSLLALSSGCASISNPVVNGVPVRRVPAEFLVEPKNDQQTIPLTSLRKKPSEKYILGPADTLGIWIEGVLGEKGQLPPVQQPPLGSDLPPSLGFPIVVQDDGTISLPYVEPIHVKGKTLPEAEEEIRKAYTVDKQILVPGRERIFVTLMQPRKYRILVVRQDSGGLTVGGLGGGGGVGGGGGGGGGAGLLGNTKRGTGYVLDLSPEENDVLTALTKTGGLPGLDARDEVMIERGAFRGDQDLDNLRQSYEAFQPGCNFDGLGGGADGSNGRRVTRIKLRSRPNRPRNFRPEDIELHTGDVVFIEARIQDVWFAGGLLGGGVKFLPRDRDLDVIEAISSTGFPVVSSGVSPGNLSGAISTGGIGFPSPSLVTVVRKTPDGGQLPIRVDLNRALRDPRERLLIMQNDVVILQFSPEEAFAQYILGKFSFNTSYLVDHSSRSTTTFGSIFP